MKKTALYKEHINLNAKMVDFADHMMPVNYSNGIQFEYNSIRNGNGMFDVSHMGQIVVEGDESLQLLQFCLINDLKNIKIGEAQYSAICNEEGGIKDDIIVYCNKKNYMLIVNASNCKKIFNWIKYNNNWSDKYEGGSAVGWLDKKSKNNIVKTCRLSDEIKEKVLLLKMDIQGGEYKCLLGAEQLIDNYGVDIMIIEFTGDKKILDFLEKKDYIVFDLEYVQWNVKNNESTFNNKKVIPEEKFILSNGLPARRIFYSDRPSDVNNYIQFLNNFPNKDFDGQQTDLLCIHKSAYDKIFPLLENISKGKQSIFIKIKDYLFNNKVIILIFLIFIIVYLYGEKS